MLHDSALYKSAIDSDIDQPRYCDTGKIQAYIWRRMILPGQARADWVMSRTTQTHMGNLKGAKKRACVHLCCRS